MDLENQAQSTSSNSENIFINGKAQIIEMLQVMPHSEREKLLKNIKLRNASLAQELVQESVTFESIEHLSDFHLQLLFKYVKPPILGLALKLCRPAFQKNILRSLDRSYAQEAFEVLTSPIHNEKHDAQRAQRKILEVLVSLSRRNQISL